METINSKLFSQASLAADDLARRFSALGEAARKIEFPPLREVAQERLALLTKEHGLFRFTLADYWAWRRICNMRSKA